MIEKLINLHIGAAAPPQAVDCTAGDTMWRWRFRLYLNGLRWPLPESGRATFVGLKEDGNVFDVPATINGDEIEVDADEQITAFPGNVYSVLRVFDGSDDTVATCPVVLHVKNNPQGSGVVSNTVVTSYENIATELEEALEGEIHEIPFTITSSDDGKVLQVVDGEWRLVNLPSAILMDQEDD